MVHFSLQLTIFLLLAASLPLPPISVSSARGLPDPGSRSLTQPWLTNRVGKFKRSWQFS